MLITLVWKPNLELAGVIRPTDNKEHTDFEGCLFQDIMLGDYDIDNGIFRMVECVKP